MINLLAAALSVSLSSPACDAPLAVPPLSMPRVAGRTVDTTYQRLFESGVTFADFLKHAKSRREQWERNYGGGTVADAVVTRARAAGGPWKLLVVAVDGCSDSVNTVPYLARLTEQLMGAELRIVDSEVGRAVMEAHRSVDGRAATPTVILLDSNYEERGCWVERPTELRQWMVEHKGKLKDSELFDHKMAWYDSDKGAMTVEDVVAVIEAAAKGEKRC